MSWAGFQLSSATKAEVRRLYAIGEKVRAVKVVYDNLPGDCTLPQAIWYTRALCGAVLTTPGKGEG